MNRYRWALLAAVLLLSACGPSPAPTPGKDDFHAREQAEMEKARMDFSRVMTVRLKHDGKRLEVASIVPTTVAETLVAGHSAKTIFRVNDRVDGLVLFSRDLPHGKSVKTEIGFSQLTDKRQFTFPVVQPDGSLREETFIVEQIVQPPSL